MPEEENILKMILEKETWEDVIYYIVSVENIDPWNVDIVKLVESFMQFIKTVKDLDFRIPAKIVFVAAILLRLKADYLSFFEEKEDTEEMLKEKKPFEELGIDPNLAQLGYPMKRIPKRQVTLEELMDALRKATTVKEKREVRRRLWRARVEENIEVGEGIEVRIEKIMKDIDELLAKGNQEKIKFKQLVKEWKRDKVVESFIPLLHLEQDQKVETEQEELFKDVWIKKK